MGGECHIPTVVEQATHAPSTDESSIRYEGWPVAAAGGAGVFLASLFVYTFGLFLKPLSDEFGWSREAIASAYGMAAIMSALCAAPLGYLFDRVRAAFLIVPCLALIAAAFVSLSVMTPHLSHLYATFAVFGIAGTGTSAIAYSRAVFSWFERRRGLAFGLVVSGGAIGSLAHPPLADAIIRGLGWRGASLVLGVVVVAVGVPVMSKWMRERPAATTTPGAPAAGASVAEGLRSRQFWTQFVVLFCSALAQNSTIVHLAPLLTDRGVSTSQAALAVSAMGGGSLAGRLLAGWMLDRLFAPYVSFALLTIAALGTLILANAETFAVGALAAACIGFGMGGESDVTPYLFSRYFGRRSFSTLYALTWTATGIAAAAGPIMMGRAFDTTGSYRSLLLVMATITFAVASLMFTMPRYASLHQSDT